MAMLFRSAISTDDDLGTACREAARKAKEALDGASPDLGLAFVSTRYGSLEHVPELLRDECGEIALAGCSGGGIIGAGLEVEGEPAVSVSLGSLPGVELHLRHLTVEELPDPDAAPTAWTSMLGAAAAQTKGLVVIPEPFTFPADRLLQGLDYAYPGVAKVGGLASGGDQPGQHSLFADTSCHHSGAVVLALCGAVELDTLVAQGCRPFGRAGRITSCENHHLIAVDGEPALQFLQGQIEGLPAGEVELVRSSPIFLGIGMDPFAVDSPGPGDFLIRNILGYDQDSGMMVIGQKLATGRHVQFHLRDRRSSAEDLREVLARSAPDGKPQGALLFSCLGRGEHLYGEKGHDSRVFREVIGKVAIGGFFCNGEIGPIGGTTHLHGYTSSFALFRESRR